ncbi:DNA-binding GntR family transcriptional regulator [Kineosphaera limosa]|uniref:GntR family transcriptional regulator n=1 Tax=Kineosphaera limosa TaxID=111564 RepID=UPI0003073DBA|nr:GntR family transcriptional regulator [Kineosphaera limosa]NYE00172.1 DNA-binding GntR family transcriptional regulator [Kineosphaera limosa]
MSDADQRPADAQADQDDSAGAGGLVAVLTRPSGYTSGPQVLAELRRAIASGEVAPGTAIPLDDVAGFFGVSRIPVREALKTLLGEGLLDHEPRLGYTVARLSDAELGELYLVAGALEAAGLARAVENATEADHEHLRQIHGQVDTAVVADPVAFGRLSRAFHEAMLAPCRMPRLLHMLRVAWNVTEPSKAMVRLTRDEREHLRVDHEQILAAYVARDAQLLGSLAHEHTERIGAAVAAPDSASPEHG